MSMIAAGSLWRKWDLHIHSPESALNNQFEGLSKEEKWEKYLCCLELLTDIPVLGITDYFSIDGYKKAQKEKENGRLPNIELLIPNVELRITPVTGSSIPINLHLLFDPDIVELLDACFFQELKFNYERNEYKCTNDGLIRLGRRVKRNDGLDEISAYKMGVEQFKVNYQSIVDVLGKNEKLTGRYLIGVSNNSEDGNSGLQESGLLAMRQEIYRLSHFVFSANPSDIDYFLGKGVDSKEKVKEDYGSLKPCLHGSDAHQLDKICNPDLDRFTWIKADPTFEGLKQTIYEPELRVRIKKDNPENDYPKHYFSSISIEGKPFGDERLEFERAVIPINRDLVTIIGGRGTGKSMLLDTLFRTFNIPGDGDRLDSFRVIPFSVCLTKGTNKETVAFPLSEEAKQYEYLHVRQGQVKGIVDRSSDLHREVLRLLGPSSFMVDPTIEEEIARKNKEISELRSFFRQQNENGEMVNSTDYHNHQIEQNKALIKTLTTEETRKQVDQFTENSNQYSILETLILDSRRLHNDLLRFSVITDRDIKLINEKISEHGLVQITELDFSPQLDQLMELIQVLEKKQVDLQQGNRKIEEKLTEKGFKGDIPSLFSKAEAYQRAIQQSDAQIQRIKILKERQDALIQERRVSAEQIKKNLISELEDIGDRFRNRQAGAEEAIERKELLKSMLDGIEISGAIEFNQEQFVDGLWEYIDGRKFRATQTQSGKERFAETLGVNTEEDFLKLIAGEPTITSITNGQLQNIDEFIETPDLFYPETENSLFNYLFLRSNRQKYLRVVPKIRYQQKDLSRISVGQRGTFYLCLKLATESFSIPFVFDQPEDDLDNEFIFEHLLPIFRQIKQYRQVIIVTHNANLVVNADSDQIIIANNFEEKLSYQAGSLENPEIRECICRILEGGKEAFLNREKRYGIRQ
jgi:ABC-type cobalamin/Fe3+-siderophores transport system ATPase subunit